MSITVNVTTSPTPVAVDFTPPASVPVAVEFAPARDAYQLALAEGFEGSREEWIASLQGTPGEPGATGDPGANAQIVILTLAEYLALPPETQMDGRWYVVPKA